VKQVHLVGLACLLAGVLLAGCGEGGKLVDALPKSVGVPGWNPAGELQRFVQDNLYDLVDGQADSFFAYGFEEVVVREYENAAGETVRIEVWQLATPADAFGLFSVTRAGQPVALGNSGDSDAGRRLDFWQDRYFVRLFAPSPLDDAGLQALARGISAKLPEGGAEPHLLELLPAEGRVERTEVFFHSEISIQDWLWLGGQNVLGLGPNTEAVLARYTSAEGLGWLLLAEYPNSAQAKASLQRLETASVPDLVAAEVQGSLLGAVFGPVLQDTAVRWLRQSLSAD